MNLDVLRHDSLPAVVRRTLDSLLEHIHGYLVERIEHLSGNSHVTLLCDFPNCIFYDQSHSFTDNPPRTQLYSYACLFINGF